MKIERLPEPLWGATTCWVVAISAILWNRSWVLAGWGGGHLYTYWKLSQLAGHNLSWVLHILQSLFLKLYFFHLHLVWFFIWCGCYLCYVWICTQWVYSRELEAIFVKNEFSCHQGQSHALWIIPLPSLLSTVHTRVVKEARLHSKYTVSMHESWFHCSVKRQRPMKTGAPCPGFSSPRKHSWVA